MEWPVVLTAKFEEKFLAVPAEALVYTMKGDQKYFPVYVSHWQTAAELYLRCQHRIERSAANHSR